MLRKLIATVSVLLLAFGVTSVVGTAASAHTGDLDATAVCQADGTYLVTYTLKTANTNLTGTTYWKIGGDSFEGTPGSAAGLTNGPLTVAPNVKVTLGTTTLPGNTTKAPWAYAYTTWSDNYGVGSDGGNIKLKGDCKPPTTKVVPVNPTIVDQCGTANDSVTLPGSPEGVTYTQDGNYVIATITGANLKWGSLPDGWTKVNDSKAKFKVKLTNETCKHTETVCWLMDAYGKNSKQPKAGSESTFPQTRVNCNDPIPCGMWVQKDVYEIKDAKGEDVWNNLGDTLEWVKDRKGGKGHPEDQEIYKSHVFIYGGDCPPPPFCKIDHKKYYEGDTLPAHYTWVNGGKCTYTPPICTYDGVKYWDATDLPDGVIYDEQQGTCYVPPFCTIGETKYYEGDQLPDHYTWSQDGECVYTPPICTYDGVDYWDANDLPDGVVYDEQEGTCYVPPFCTIGDTKYFAGDELPDHYTWTEQGECVYTPPVCTFDGVEYWDARSLPAGAIYDQETKTCRSLQEPTLTATLTPMCIQNVPFVEWTAVLTDPDNQSTNNTHINFTFLNTKNAQGDWTSEDLGLSPAGGGTYTGSGMFTWPYASYSGSLPGTILGLTWPGWTHDVLTDTWTEGADEPGGWTRGGVNVLAKVNPEYVVSGVQYPAQTFPCVPDLHNELDAPPATPVDAEANYAG